MITVESVSKSFKNRPAVDDISFAAHEKEILVLLGTSGCGKTTTLKMINRLIESDSGRILIDGKNIKDHNVEQLRMGIGYVMQNSGLFPHYTVAENIAVVPKLQKWNSKQIKDRTEELIQKLHLSGDVLKQISPRIKRRTTATRRNSQSFNRQYSRLTDGRTFRSIG